MGSIYEYATKSWPVIKGCDNSLPCAARCWAKRECHRLKDNPNPKIAEFHKGLTNSFVGGHSNWTGTVKLNEAHLEDPLHWRKPEIVAVAYHGDIGLAQCEDLRRIWNITAQCQRHTFLLLTKRTAKVREFQQWMVGADDISAAEWPQNVWLGTSVSTQAEAEQRIPGLLRIPAAHHWLSLEPMVGGVDLTPWLLTGLQWVVLGAESGPNARPMDFNWVRDIQRQCAAAGVPFFFKQAIVNGVKVAAPLLDGRRWVELPEGM